jgi:hypothetical protein
MIFACNFNHLRMKTCKLDYDEVSETGTSYLVYIRTRFLTHQKLQMVNIFRMSRCDDSK